MNVKNCDTSSNEEFQIMFRVEGLIAPNEGVSLNNSLLITGIDNRDTSLVTFKLSNEDYEKTQKNEIPQMKFLQNILQIYGLITDRKVTLLSGYSCGKITEETPLGKIPYGIIKAYLNVDAKQKEKNKDFIKKTIKKYESIKNIFENRNKLYLINAIDYYNRSLADERIEEEFIDLMISLESLFSRENDELALRYSLRIAFLVGCEDEKYRAEIFKLTKKLYTKRSKIVHGTGEKELEYTDISKFRKMINTAIKIMVNINLRKQDLLDLIDEAIYSDTKRQELFKKIQLVTDEW